MGIVQQSEGLIDHSGADGIMMRVEETSAFSTRLIRSRLRTRLGDDAPTTLLNGVRAMPPDSDQTRWKMLERNAHQPDVQKLIRQEIRDRTIRVVPGFNGGIRIIPTDLRTRISDPSRRNQPDAELTVG
jgi:hypothetical protein